MARATAPMLLGLRARTSTTQTRARCSSLNIDLCWMGQRRVPSYSHWLEVSEHLLKFGKIRRHFIGAHGLEALPDFQHHRIGMGARDGLLREPFKDLNHRSILGAHDD